MAVVCALQPIPNQGAHTREGLFSIAFVEKLQRLERLGAVRSAADWKLLRELRNALAHDYPDASELQAAWLNRLMGSIPTLLAMAQVAQAFAQRLRLALLG